MAAEQTLFAQVWNAIASDPILQFFLVLMLILAAIQAVSSFIGREYDFKSAIITLGVLGAFFGIFVGLAGFNTEDIMGSIPILLSGMKLSFLSSIAGMALAMMLSVLEAVRHGQQEEEEENTGDLPEISRKLNRLKELEDALASQREQQKNFEGIFRSSNEQLYTEIRQVSGEIRQGFEQTNETLNATLKLMSRGATDEVVKALTKVTQDFNRNLTEQFGENFKHLNIAVGRLVEWQDHYKDVLEDAGKHLQVLQTSLTQSERTMAAVASANSDTRAIFEQLGRQIEKYDVQVHALTKQLNDYLSIGTRAASAFEQIDTSISKIARELDLLTTQIQNSLAKQSEALSALTGEIEAKLPDSLGQLENTLTGITSRFGRDYELFLQRVNQLLPR